MAEPAVQRRKVEIADRRRKVAELYLRGAYQAEIAQELGVDQATVSRDLAQLRREWLDRSINHIEQRKAIELAKLDQLELEYWEAWERSKQNAETRVTRKTPQGTYSENRKTGQTGNPAFLAGVLSCIDKRCEILGLDAPKRADITSGGQPLPDSESVYERIMARIQARLAEDETEGPGGPAAGDDPG